MDDNTHDGDIKLFSTCPPSSGADKDAYLQRVIDVACWSERAGYRGILVYADNSQMDPWLLAHIIVQNTRALCPLVAVQPVYMHPYTVAKTVTSIGNLYGRRVYLNMVAGGFKNDLAALNDTTLHDKRYDRLVEYTAIIQQLLAGAAPVSYAGKFYRVEQLKLSPPLSAELFPGIFVSGSSAAGLAAAKALGATTVQYPEPLAQNQNGTLADNKDAGIRIGIVSRKREQEAWAVAHARFPEDREGQLTHQLAMKVSDSAWHKQLSELGEVKENNPYWLVPFKNYKTMCPYLVGDYERVGRELAGYMALGYRTFILDVPASMEELDHIQTVFGRASEIAACRSYSKTM